MPFMVLELDPHLYLTETTWTTMYWAQPGVAVDGVHKTCKSRYWTHSLLSPLACLPVSGTFATEFSSQIGPSRAFRMDWQFYAGLAVGLNPSALDTVRLEGTDVLPAVQLK
jgi:hypothetical protein